MDALVLSNEMAIRLGFFFATLVVMGLWEWLAPRRALSVSRLRRWLNNLSVVFFNTVLIRVLFPAAAVGVAALAAGQGWGSNVRLPLALDRVLRLFVVTPDMHRVHHSIAHDETNSNFGFNLPWWDRLFGTYRAQPRAGHEGMTIGIELFRAEREVTGFFRMLQIPFRSRGEDGAGAGHSARQGR
jgi:hypothetical protein